MGSNVPLYEPITMLRDCEAVLIPSGTPINVPKDTIVYVTQALGGSITVNVNGNLARVAGRDFDALGLEPEARREVSADPNAAEVEAAVWDELRTCYDPEIPINIVELGLIYECNVAAVDPADDSKGFKVDVAMTLTAPGCGMGEVLVEDIRGKVKLIPKVAELDVQLVFDPPWDSSMMSEAARLQTGML